MNYKHSCVVDAAGFYRDYVLIQIDSNQNEYIQFYTLAEGERLVNTSPPSARIHAGTQGFVKPQWNSAEWIEGATQEEIARWERENPAPPTPAPSAEKQLAALLLGQAQGEIQLTQQRTINAMLMLQIAQAQAGGEGNV